MPTFVFPSSREVNQIAQVKLPNLETARSIFQILPVETRDTDTLEWDQEDNYIGLQQIRGLNGEPPRVKRVGLKRYIMEPGAYGEFTVIDERELTKRRSFGSGDAPVDISDLVMRCQDQLLGRRLDRIEQIGWTLLTTGTFSVAGPGGAVMHTDTFALQTASAAVVWSTVATATPLIDFRAIQLLSRGNSVNFGSRARAYMNRVTANNLLRNTNAADLGGKRTSGLAGVNSMNDVNALLLGEDLPQIVVEDGGYLDDTGTFQPFIPNAKVVVVGARTDGSRIGRYVYTRNANNDGLAPGAYMKVIDRGEDSVPRLIEVHDGHNGGPVIEYPSAIVILSV